ncbi:MAG: redoxin domain-containing protein [Thiohalomonadales bacterium]
MFIKLKQLFKNRWIKYSAEIIVILIIFLSFKAYKQQDVVKGIAPDFQEVFLDGTQVKLADYRGNSVLIHFWATWCQICALEQNSIEAISKDNNIITIAMNSGEAMEIQNFMEENKLSFPVIIDEDGVLANRYGVRGVPANFIVNSDGIIEYTEIGYTTNWGLRARLWLAK